MTTDAVTDEDERPQGYEDILPVTTTEDLLCPANVVFYETWAALESGGQPSARHAADLVAAENVHDVAVVVEVLEDGADFLIADLGPALLRLDPLLRAGLRISHRPDLIVKRRTLYLLRMTVCSRAPWYSRPGYSYFQGREHLRIESVALPFFGPDGAVCLIIGRYDLVPAGTETA